jgi:hypothetical protein
LKLEAAMPMALNHNLVLEMPFGHGVEDARFALSQGFEISASAMMIEVEVNK